jgi:hypothetical protein
MQRSGAICDIKDLQVWFNACGEKMMYWTLYNGTDTKGKLILRNEHTDEKKASWELLEKVLIGQSRYGGIFYVFVPSTKAGSNGFGTEITLSPQQQEGGAVAINGLGGGYGLPLGVGSLEQYRAQIQKEFELEQRIKDLEKEKDKDETTINPYIGAFLNHQTFDAKYATAGLFNVVNGLIEIGKKVAGVDIPPSVAQPVSASIAGLPSQPNGNDESDDDDETETIQIDGELLSRACSETAALIDERPEVVYLALNAYLDENRGMLGMILPQLQPYINKIKTELQA